jgi:DDE superfamily endonuclease
VFAQALIVALARRTVTGVLATCGRQFEDWSATYRIFERERFDSDKLFSVARKAVVEGLAPKDPLLVLMDDTMVPKRGKNVAETKWQHDAQGPAFCHQIAWGQRFVQISAMLIGDKKEDARAIPIDLALHRPVKKPRKPTEEQEKLYKKEKREARIPNLGASRIAQLRKSLDEDGEKTRHLVVAFDGGYTNKTLFKSIPERTTFIGRIRKDAKLFAPPSKEETQQRGRKRLYGEELPTPHELLKDETVAWKKTKVFIIGKQRWVNYKTLTNCRWRGAGGRNMQLIVIKPISSTPHKKGRRLLFANPGYLLCNDPRLSARKAIEAYCWRWEIEVGFREQKTQMGMGQAQVRTKQAVTSVLQFTAFVYALLLLAAHKADIKTLPPPKWRQRKNQSRRTTINQLISTARSEL